MFAFKPFFAFYPYIYIIYMILSLSLFKKFNSLNNCTKQYSSMYYYNMPIHSNKCNIFLNYEMIQASSNRWKDLLAKNVEKCHFDSHQNIIFLSYKE